MTHVFISWKLKSTLSLLLYVRSSYCCFYRCYFFGYSQEHFAATVTTCTTITRYIPTYLLRTYVLRNVPVSTCILFLFCCCCLKKFSESWCCYLRTCASILSFYFVCIISTWKIWKFSSCLLFCSSCYYCSSKEAPSQKTYVYLYS